MIHFGPLNPMQTLVVVGLVVVSALTLLKRKRCAIPGCRLPPGPTPLPFVGNLLSINSKRPWVTYAEWATRYGDILMIRVLKQDIVVISSRKVAKELLDRRSNIYSDRPLIASRDPFGWSFNFGWAQYGDGWRLRRRLFHQAFRAEAALAYLPVQLKKARQLVSDIFNDPRDFSKHIQRFSAAVIMSIVYDYEVAPEHDHLVELFERGNALAMESLTPESSCIIDAFPFSDLPEWLPGAVLSRKALASRRCAMEMITEPFEYAKKREALGSTAPAVALDLLRGLKDSADDYSLLQSVKETCATAFVAGAETSTSTLQWFMLAMLQYPEVQARAQGEIDRVVGTDRLPNFDDRPNLPYVEAILMEILRTYVVTPLGIPHATTADDIYEDIFIPKGSTVVANTWAIYHDKNTYPEPDVFKPERFFVDGKLNGDKSTESLAFGFGRRMCPGRYAADNSVWAGMMSILWAFKISKLVDERGNEVAFEPTFTYGVTTAPDPFPCSITPRQPNVDIQKLSTADSHDS